MTHQTCEPCRSLLTRGFKAAMSLCFALPLTVTAADTAYHLADKIRLEGKVAWDYLSFEPARQRLFITRGDHVDVFDTASKRITGSIADTHGVHGVALAPELDRGFTSNGQDNTVTVFELSTLKILGTIATGERPDAIVYDAASKRVFTANAKSQDLTAIDALAGKVLGTIAVGGKPEFAVVDGKGKLFVNIETRNQLLAVDTAKLSVSSTFDISFACDEPAGLAIDAAVQHLFVTCHNQKMAVVDGNTGKILATPPIGKGSDAAVFDAASGLVFSSNGEGTLTVIGRNDAGGYAVRQTVDTMRGARTMALDPATHTLYLVSAEYGPLAESAKAGSRPPLKEGTFTLLTVAP